PLIFVEIRHAGGAMSHPDRPSAFGHRDAELLMDMVGMAHTPAARDALQAYYGRLMAALQPARTGTVYMNFLEGDEKNTRVRDGFPPETLARLAALKTLYDPSNRLSRAMAIPVE